MPDTLTLRDRAPSNSAGVAMAAHSTTPSKAEAGVTRALAEFVVEASFDRLPETVFPRLRSLLLDTLGITAFAAGHAESSPAINAAIMRLDPTEGPATAIGMPRGFSWLHAALLNGAHAHSLDFDDTNIVEGGHPGAPVISAALSDAERLGCDGRAFFEALAVGYEVACRVGGALGDGGYNRGFHMTSVAGIFGAVAAVGKLRAFDSQTIESAFGLALSKAAGSMQYLANGAWNKRLHPGFAAHDALICAELAEAGVLGAAAAFEGQYGLLVGYTDAPHPEILTHRLGEDWILLQTAVKPYPSCRLAHGAVDAALKLRAQVPEANRSEALITVELSPTGVKIVGEAVPQKITPNNTVDAQFSVYFQVAAAWMEGQVDWAVYDRLQAPELTGMAKRITVRENKSLPNYGAILTIQVGSKTLTETVRVPLGEPDNWIGDDALRHKFLLLARPTFGDARAAQIADAVLGCAPDTSVCSIAKLLRTQPER